MVGFGMKINMKINMNPRIYDLQSFVPKCSSAWKWIWASYPHHFHCGLQSGILEGLGFLVFILLPVPFW